MNDSDSDDWLLAKRLAIIGAFLGPVLLYSASYLLHREEDAFGLIDYFWSIPAGAITGYVMPFAWPARK